MRLFIYKYQANSLFTYSEISNYTENFSDKILKTSPFRAQFQIMPEDEKKRLIKLFDKIKLDNQLFSDLIIINRTNTLKNLKIYNEEYELVFQEKYMIFILNLNYFSIITNKDLPKALRVILSKSLEKIIKLFQNLILVSKFFIISN